MDISDHISLQCNLVDNGIHPKMDHKLNCYNRIVANSLFPIVKVDKLLDKKFINLNEIRKVIKA